MLPTALTFRPAGTKRQDKFITAPKVLDTDQDGRLTYSEIKQLCMAVRLLLAMLGGGMGSAEANGFFREEVAQQEVPAPRWTRRTCCTGARRATCA